MMTHWTKPNYGQSLGVIKVMPVKQSFDSTVFTNLGFLDSAHFKSAFQCFMSKDFFPVLFPPTESSLPTFRRIGFFTNPLRLFSTPSPRALSIFLRMLLLKFPGNRKMALPASAIHRMIKSYFSISFPATLTFSHTVKLHKTMKFHNASTKQNKTWRDA